MGLDVEEPHIENGAKSPTGPAPMMTASVSIVVAPFMPKPRTAQCKRHHGDQKRTASRHD